MALSKSKRRSEDGRRIVHYWEKSDNEVLLDILHGRRVEDIDILLCLQEAMRERDSEAIMICGFLLGIPNEYERHDYLDQVLGYATV